MQIKETDLKVLFSENQIQTRIKELAEENPDNKTLQAGYKMIENQVNEILKGNDTYRTMDTTSIGNEYYKDKKPAV